MTWLLDTNVVSELRKGRGCHHAVAAWFAATPADRLFLSALTLGEVRKGVEALRPRDPERAVNLEIWLVELGRMFSERVLPVTAAVADAWGSMATLRSRPVVDTLLAATARVHGLVLVTRDRDVQGLGVRVLNPFEAP